MTNRMIDTTDDGTKPLRANQQQYVFDAQVNATVGATAPQKDEKFHALAPPSLAASASDQAVGNDGEGGHHSEEDEDPQ